MYVPKLACNILSEIKASKLGKVVEFDDAGCQVVNKSNKIIAVATKVGCFYYLEYNEFKKNQQLNVIEKESKKRLRHCQFWQTKLKRNWLIKGSYTVVSMAYLVVSVKHVLVESTTDASFRALGLHVQQNHLN